MAQVVVRGEVVYKCDKCTRKIRIPANKFGIDTLQRCTITHNCRGTLRQVTQATEVNNTPAFPPEVQGVEDWFQRRVFYVHTQTLDSTVWRIEHNLANNPIIHVYVYSNVDQETVLLETNEFTTRTIEANITEITFTRPVSGIAQAITLSSQKNVSVQVQPGVATDLQITSNTGEITLAVRISGSYPPSWANPLVDFTISYTTASGTSIKYLQVDNTPSIASPWVGARKVVADGKLYALHSFNITEQNPASPIFASGLILNGTEFHITHVNDVEIGTGDVLVLLSDSPYAAVDRMTTKFIDAGRSDVVLTYDSGKARTAVRFVKSTYPPITVV